MADTRVVDTEVILPDYLRLNSSKKSHDANSKFPSQWGAENFNAALLKRYVTFILSTKHHGVSAFDEIDEQAADDAIDLIFAKAVKREVVKHIVAQFGVTLKKYQSLPVDEQPYFLHQKAEFDAWAKAQCSAYAFDKLNDEDVKFRDENDKEALAELKKTKNRRNLEFLEELGHCSSLKGSQQADIEDKAETEIKRQKAIFIAALKNLDAFKQFCKTNSESHYDPETALQLLDKSVTKYKVNELNKGKYPTIPRYDFSETTVKLCLEWAGKYIAAGRLKKVMDARYLTADNSLQTTLNNFAIQQDLPATVSAMLSNDPEFKSFFGDYPQLSKDQLIGNCVKTLTKRYMTAKGYAELKDAIEHYDLAAVKNVYAKWVKEVWVADVIRNNELLCRDYIKHLEGRLPFAEGARSFSKNGITFELTDYAVIPNITQKSGSTIILDQIILTPSSSVNTDSKAYQSLKLTADKYNEVQRLRVKLLNSKVKQQDALNDFQKEATQETTQKLLAAHATPIEYRILKALTVGLYYKLRTGKYRGWNNKSHGARLIDTISRSFFFTCQDQKPDEDSKLGISSDQGSDKDSTLELISNQSSDNSDQASENSNQEAENSVENSDQDQPEISALTPSF